MPGIPQFAAGAEVTLIGAAGTFGGLQGTGVTPTGQTFGVHAVRGWGFEPGQAAWFTIANADGSLLISNQPQKDNPVDPSARSMAVSAYYPATDTFANVKISSATSAGDLGVTALNKGADIEDLQVLPNGDVAFDSASPWNGWDASQYGTFPTYGTLHQNGGVWSQVASVPPKRTGLGIQATNPVLGPQACPTASGNGIPYSSCHGPSEMALLPTSQDVVVGQYFATNQHGFIGTSGQLMVLKPDGTLLASYVYPDVPDISLDPLFQPRGYGCAPGDANLLVSPREVESDPTSAPDDDRFAVVFDTWHCPDPLTGKRQSAPFMIQEFSYKASTRTITPVSKAVYPGKRQNLEGANDVMSTEHARYDAQGNLWLATMFTNNPLAGAGVYVYPKTPLGRAVTANPACAWDQTAPVATQWFVQCSPLTALADAASYGTPTDIVEDPKTHAMLLVTNGNNTVYVVAVQPSGAGTGMSFAAKPALDLGIGVLQKAKAPAPAPVGTAYQVVAQKGAVDYQPGVRHFLYLPIQGVLLLESEPIPANPVTIPQYLMRIDLDQLMR
ncbi:MAG TPA: hypothetical protein VJT31_25220 [Rugosimonospora sp.]|nr:hypothetical protein [Rugosimonospora sp.]